MDNSVKKWMIRAGAFLVLFGFFIPSMAVSCSAFGVTQKQSFSMMSAASQLRQGVLYLVVAGAILTLFFSFLIPRNNQQKLLFAAGEGGGLALGGFGILISLASLYSQIQGMGLNFSVEPGFFVLALGYGAAGVGVLMDFFNPAARLSASYRKPPPYGAPELEATKAPAFPFSSPPPMFSPSASGARLELVRGNAPRATALNAPDFHIGRSSRNHCVVNDPQVSRVHFRLREAQGAWFIQDQNSSGGTYVNGARVQAQRLNDGDEIQIGETVFRFRG